MLNTEDKNNRPYLVSIDWLQIHVRCRANFDPFSPNLLGYAFRPLGHGSKTFKQLLEVYEPDGIMLGVIAMLPYSPQLHPLTCIFKVENSVLYEADMVSRIFNFFGACELQYKGITRLDICYDSNELYGGLKHQSLMQNYISKRYLKIGLNRGWLAFNLGYTLNVNKKGYKTILSNEDKSQRPLDHIPDMDIETVTWGSRASDVQVQVYNKSAELRQVKMKHHIVNAWKQAGIDTEREVYRVEIRIARGGKQLKNTKNGSRFDLSLNEILTQDLLEQLFSDYAHKYFRFFINKGIGRIQRMKEIKLFCLNRQHIVRPQRLTKKKDFSKMHKVLINYLDKQIVSNKELDNEVVEELTKAKEYFIQAYGMEKWYQDIKRQRIAQLKQHQQNQLNEENLYDVYLEGLERTAAKRAAQFRAELEAEKIRIAQLLEEEKSDFGELYKQDILRRWGGK